MAEGIKVVKSAPRAKRAICRLSSVSLRGSEWGRTIGNGQEVDLLEQLAPGVTLEAALGDHVSGFELIDGQEKG